MREEKWCSFRVRDSGQHEKRKGRMRSEDGTVFFRVSPIAANALILVKMEMGEIWGRFGGFLELIILRG